MKRTGHEQRRAGRKRVDTAIPVLNALDDSALGRIGNLSATGLMLIGPRALGDGALYQFRFQLPGSDGHAHTLELGVQQQWCESSGSSGQRWTGLRIISIAPDDALVLEDWLDSPNPLPT